MIEYNEILKEKNREKRIEIVLTDAYGDDEQNEAICCYLSDYMVFPFDAKIRDDKNSEIFRVLRFTSITPNQIVCEINLNGRITRISLTEIEPIDKKSTNNLIIEDYLYFIDGNYNFEI
ncbi:MAG: calcium-binding protein [Candidatus Woesearchaeota archaeon]